MAYISTEKPKSDAPVKIKCRCGVAFWLTADTDRHLRMSSQTFYCPFGHASVWPQGESEEDKLRRERDRLKQENARLEEMQRMALATANAQRDQRLAAERSASAYRGQVTRLKNRAAAGVCPCCNRTFVNLRRHMAAKHAGFLAEEVAPEGASIQ